MLKLAHKNINFYEEPLTNSNLFLGLQDYISIISFMKKVSVCKIIQPTTNLHEKEFLREKRLFIDLVEILKKQTKSDKRRDFLCDIYEKYSKKRAISSLPLSALDWFFQCFIATWFLVIHFIFPQCFFIFTFYVCYNCSNDL